MRELKSWKLFSVRGVDVNAHVSLVFLVLYILLIASMQFSGVARSSGIDPFLLRGSPLLWAMAFAVSLIFSILLHEFGHVLVAQKYGAKVKRITLMMLGGASEMEGATMPPAREWKVALIGPIVSLVIA